MKTMVWRAVLGLFLACGLVAVAEMDLEWAYHDDADDIDDRTGETVPGESFGFIGNGSTIIADNEPVYLYVLTVNQFAGDQEEQVFVRWWNGHEEFWVMGDWEKNIHVGSDQLAGTLHGLPTDGEVMLDLWKVEVGPELTKPGENFYVIQLKGWEEGNPVEYYLLRDKPDEGGQLNELDQAWTAEGNYFGHDWSLTIKE